MVTAVTHSNVTVIERSVFTQSGFLPKDIAENREKKNQFLNSTQSELLTLKNQFEVQLKETETELKEAYEMINFLVQKIDKLEVHGSYESKDVVQIDHEKQHRFS